MNKKKKRPFNIDYPNSKRMVGNSRKPSSGVSSSLTDITLESPKTVQGTF